MKVYAVLQDYYCNAYDYPDIDGNVLFGIAKTFDEARDLMTLFVDENLESTDCVFDKFEVGLETWDKIGIGNYATEIEYRIVEYDI